MSAAPTVEDAINANPAGVWVLKDVLNGHIKPFGICLVVELAVNGICSGGILLAWLPA
jgi:hypothetical protein